MKDNGLDHHYRVLKQFLDISEDQNYRVKPLSTRAQRAREKLLKLSEAQFKELSTDVYDELRRRIDESRSEPDFLLPKLSFHPKRNQARQKLSALPQARFKDLVCDIAFEIERRHLNVSTTASHARMPSESSTLRKLTVGDTAPNPAQPYAGASRRAESYSESGASYAPETGAITSSGTSNFNAGTAMGVGAGVGAGVAGIAAVGSLYDNSAHSPTETDGTSSPIGGYHNVSGADTAIGPNDLADMSHSTTAPVNEVASPVSERSAVGKNSINVLSKTVVPVKANLAWSSDEEEEEPEHPVRSDLLAENEQNSQGIDYSVLKNDFEDLNAEGDGFDIQKRELEHAIAPRNVSLEGSHYNAHEEDEVEEVPVQRGLFSMPLASPARAVPDNKQTELEDEIAELRNKLMSLENEYTELQEKHSTAQEEYENYKIDNENLSHEVSQLRKALSLHQEESAKAVAPTDAPEFKELASNYELLKTSNAALNLELQSLKAEHKQLEARAEKTRSIDILPTKAKGLHPPAVVVSSMQTNGGWDNFLDRLESIEPLNKAVSTEKPVTQHELHKQIIEWQEKYENVRANQIATSFNNKMLDQKTIKLLVSPSGLLSIKMVSELQSLIESYLLYISEDEYEPEILFDKISKLSILANEVAIQGDNYKPNSNEYSVLLREAASYALTATRYLASHQSFLPKIIVERAVSEIGFALCDLAATGKLNENSVLSREVSIQRHNPVRNTVDEEFGVRPLRMTNKLRANSTASSFTTAQEDITTSDATSTTFNQEDNAPIVSQQLNAYKSTPKQIRLGQVPVIMSSNKRFSDDRDLHDSRRETVSTIESGSDYDADVFIGQRSPIIAKVHNGVGDFSPFKEEGIKNALSSTINVIPSPPRIEKEREILKEEDSPFTDIKSNTKDEVELSRDLSVVHEKNIINQDYTDKVEEPLKDTAPSQRDLNITKTSPEVKKSALAQKLQKFTESSDDVRTSVETPRKTPQTSKISDLANRFESSRTPEDKSPLRSANGLPSSKVSPAIAKLTSKLNGMSDSLPSNTSFGSGGRKDSESFLDKVKRFEVTPSKLQLKESKVGASQESLTKSVDFESPKERDAKSTPVEIEETTESPVTRGKSFLGKLRDRFTGESPVKTVPETQTETVQKPISGDDDLSEISGERSSINSSSVKENITDDTDESSDKKVDAETQSQYLAKRFEVESIAESEATFEQPDPFPHKLVSFSHSPSEMSTSRNTLSSLTSRADNFQDASLAPLPSIAAPTLQSSLNRNGSKSNGKKVNILEEPVIVAPSQEYDSDYDTEQSQDNYAYPDGESLQHRGEEEARQRQEYRKSMAAATFNIKLFDINDPDNTVTQVLLYLEHQTVKVISTIQSLLSAIKKQGVTRGELSTNAQAITIVITQMTEATNTSMNQTRNYQLKEHGNWVVKSLEDCCQRMNALTQAHSESNDDDFADKNFKQRLAGISFDIAKCTKELVKSVEEASLKEEIDQLNAKLSTTAGDEW